MTHGGQKIRLGALCSFGGFLGLLECLLGLALAGDVQQNAVPDRAGFCAAWSRAAAQPAHRPMGHHDAKLVVKQTQCLM